MKVELINSTNYPLRQAYLAAKICTTNNTDFEAACDVIDEKKMERVVCACLDSGHESVLEHCTATFLVQGISRACSHQLVRHRLASYSQQSQRYVNMENADFVIPPSLGKDTERRKEFIVAYREAMQHYRDLIEKWHIKPEDARYILPEATATSIIISMNARELIHFFGLRCCQRAQWEIRELANKMLSECEEWFPEVFDGSGAKCDRLGYCDERDSCGRSPRLNDFFIVLDKIEGNWRY